MKDESRMRYKTLVQSLMVGFNFLKCCWINRPKSNTPVPFVHGSTLINNYYKEVLWESYSLIQDTFISFGF